MPQSCVMFFPCFLLRFSVTMRLLPNIAISIISICCSFIKRIHQDIWSKKYTLYIFSCMGTYGPPCLYDSLHIVISRFSFGISFFVHCFRPEFSRIISFFAMCDFVKRTEGTIKTFAYILLKIHNIPDRKKKARYTEKIYFFLVYIGSVKRVISSHGDIQMW